MSTQPRSSSHGKQIESFETWYNDSDAVFRFTARISFVDTDSADEAEPEMQWIALRSFTDYRQGYTDMQPHSFAKTVFNITDSGLHKSDGIHSSVNVTLAIEWGSTAEKRRWIERARPDALRIRPGRRIAPR